MTAGLTNGAMLAVMLLHALFGCCWHHTHAACADAAAVCEAAPACPCGHSHGDAPVPEESPAPCCPDGGGCTECDCSFLASKGVETPDRTYDGLSVTVVASLSVDAAAYASLTDRRDFGIVHGSTTPRLLSRLCVWRL